MHDVRRAAIAARKNFCADTAIALARTCFRESQQSGDLALALLGLHSLFMAVAHRLEGPVKTKDVDELRRHVAPVIEALEGADSIDTTRLGQAVAAVLSSPVGSDLEF